MGFDPDEYLKNSSGGFDPDAYLAQSEKPSVLATAIRKGAQGLSSGFSDEFAGQVEKFGRRVGVEGLGGPIKDISLAKDGPTQDDAILEAAYQKGRDDERTRLKIDSEVNPGTSFVSEIGGAVASPVNKLAKGMSLVKGGAVLGGLYGLGTSERESLAGNIVDTALGAGTGAAFGLGVDKLSKAIAPASQAVAQKISPALEKKNTKEIIAAADRLGIKVTPGMLDDTGFVQRLEYTLANSPSLFGQSVARNQKAVLEKVDDAVLEATKDASNLTPYQIGDKFKSGLTAKVGERLDPIKAAFDDVAESTKAIGITDKSKQAIIRNIKQIPEVRLSGGKGKVGEYIDMISNIKTADDAKTVSSLLSSEIRATQGKDKLVLMAIKDKVSTIETKSINRAALTAAKEAGLKGDSGKQIGKEIISDLKGARKGYQELASDLSAIAENTRVKFQGGPSAYLDRVESIPNEQIQRKFFNTENLRQLEGLKSKFPEEFNLLKQGKLQEIVENSLKPVSQVDAGISSVKFINEVNKINPEAKKLLFGDAVKLLKDIETVQRSMPKNFNPSGTASELGWQDALWRNVKDTRNYVLYKGASTNLGKKITTKMQTPDFTPIQKKLSGAIVKAQGPGVIGSGTAASSGLKGIEKWIAKGQERVLEADSNIDPEFLKSYPQTKQEKDLLIRAGELKPSSQRMNEVVDEIKKSEKYKKFQKEKEKQAQGKEPNQSKATPKIKFPLVVQKDGYTAVVRNLDELNEAKGEGWA